MKKRSDRSFTVLILLMWMAIVAIGMAYLILAASACVRASSPDGERPGSCPARHDSIRSRTGRVECYRPSQVPR